jgi:hypothetical protein
MDKPTNDVFQEAQQLGVTLEQENGGWVAYLPTSGSEEDLGFPAPTEAEALDEVRAYRAIEESATYKFEYDEQADVYVVKWGGTPTTDKLLAKAYRKAQAAYAQAIATIPPEPEPAPPPAPAKARKPRTPKAAAPVNTAEPEVPWDPACAADPSPGQEARVAPVVGLALVAEILADVAEILRKRSQP